MLWSVNVVHELVTCKIKHKKFAQYFAKFFGYRIFDRQPVKLPIGYVTSQICHRSNVPVTGQICGLWPDI